MSGMRRGSTPLYSSLVNSRPGARALTGDSLRLIVVNFRRPSLA